MRRIALYGRHDVVRDWAAIAPDTQTSGQSKAAGSLTSASTDSGIAANDQQEAERCNSRPSFARQQEVEVEASAINEPHPDSPPEDEADLFFGGGDGEEATPAAEPDPGSFDPVSGSFPTPDGEAPDITEEQAETAKAAQADEQEQQAKLRAIAEREAAEKEADEAAAEAQTAEADAPPADAEPAPGDTAPGGKQSGALEREYIVFQKIALSEKVLKHLLTQIEEGKAAEPRVAYFELHRCEARNVNGAVGAAYTKHQKVLGEKADMAAVSARSFQEKHVEPKQRVESSISIT